MVEAHAFSSKLPAISGVAPSQSRHGIFAETHQGACAADRESLFAAVCGGLVTPNLSRTRMRTCAERFGFFVRQ